MYKFSQRLTVPEDLCSLLKGFSRAAIKTQPQDLHEFAAFYFAALLRLRAEKPDLGLADLVKEFSQSRVLKLYCSRVAEDSCVERQGRISKPTPLWTTQSSGYCSSVVQQDKCFTEKPSTPSNPNHTIQTGSSEQEVVVFRRKPKTDDVQSSSNPNVCRQTASAVYEQVPLSETDVLSDTVVIRTQTVPCEYMFVVHSDDVPETIVFKKDSSSTNVVEAATLKENDVKEDHIPPATQQVLDKNEASVAPGTMESPKDPSEECETPLMDPTPKPEQMPSEAGATNLTQEPQVVDEIKSSGAVGNPEFVKDPSILPTPGLPESLNGEESEKQSDSPPVEAPLEQMLPDAKATNLTQDSLAMEEIEDSKAGREVQPTESTPDITEGADVPSLAKAIDLTQEPGFVEEIKGPENAGQTESAPDHVLYTCTNGKSSINGEESGTALTESTPEMLNDASNLKQMPIEARVTDMTPELALEEADEPSLSTDTRVQSSLNLEESNKMLTESSLEILEDVSDHLLSAPLEQMPTEANATDKTPEQETEEDIRGPEVAGEIMPSEDPSVLSCLGVQQTLNGEEPNEEPEMPLTESTPEIMEDEQIPEARATSLTPLVDEGIKGSEGAGWKEPGEDHLNGNGLCDIGPLESTEESVGQMSPEAGATSLTHAPLAVDGNKPSEAAGLMELPSYPLYQEEPDILCERAPLTEPTEEAQNIIDGTDSSPLAASVRQMPLEPRASNLSQETPGTMGYFDLASSPLPLEVSNTSESTQQIETSQKLCSRTSEDNLGNQSLMVVDSSESTHPDPNSLQHAGIPDPENPSTLVTDLTERSIPAQVETIPDTSHPSPKEEDIHGAEFDERSRSDVETSPGVDAGISLVPPSRVTSLHSDQESARLVPSPSAGQNQPSPEGSRFPPTAQSPLTWVPPSPCSCHVGAASFHETSSPRPCDGVPPVLHPVLAFSSTAAIGGNLRLCHLACPESTSHLVECCTNGSMDFRMRYILTADPQSLPTHHCSSQTWSITAQCSLNGVITIPMVPPSQNSDCSSAHPEGLSPPHYVLIDSSCPVQTEPIVLRPDLLQQPNGSGCCARNEPSQTSNGSSEQELKITGRHSNSDRKESVIN